MSHEAWVKQAESDLAASSLLSDAGHHSQAVWLAAQAVEKAHKAVLVALGLRYEERHFKGLGHGITAIAALLPEELHEPRDQAVAEKAAKLESAARGARYPQVEQKAGAAIPRGLVAPAEAIAASAELVADARHLLNWCKERILRAQRAVRSMRP